jgi:integrase
VSALRAGDRQPAGWHAEAEWSHIEAAAARVVAVMRRCLRQLGTFLAPRSVDAADSALRQLARWMITEAGLAVADHRGALDRHIISRIVHRVARAAGVRGVHPHRLPHILASQAKRRGVASVQHSAEGVRTAS